MKEYEIDMYGNAGIYLADGNTFTFQLGEGDSIFGADQLFQSPLLESPFGGTFWMQQHHYLGIQGYQVLMRGYNNQQCDEVTKEIKENRLLPRLYSKEIKMLYGHGLAVYKQAIEDGKLVRKYEEQPEVMEWLDSWSSRGIPSVEEFCKTCIKNFYYFGDFFVKWRFTRGKVIGMGKPIAALEAMENRYCRLATTRQDVASELISYGDFKQVVVGRFSYGLSSYSVYPKFSFNEVDNYRYAAISHHREKSVDEFYGANETHQGARPYIQGSNKTARYINSFLKNSLAAKVHVIIPNAWIQSKRTQMTKLCEENKRRKAKGMELLKYNGIDIGTDFKESCMVRYVRDEVRKFSSYLSGADNQGKGFSSISFMDAQGHEQSWKVETIDLKYKEYIEALISYDKRTEQALLSSVGLDAAISAVDKDGVISKSGSDTYYNYLIYIMSLTSEDEVCAEPLNWALRMNFPELYKQGCRLGFYREVPQRQEDITPSQRLNQQQA